VNYDETVTELDALVGSVVWIGVRIEGKPLVATLMGPLVGWRDITANVRARYDQLSEEEARRKSEGCYWIGSLPRRLLGTLRLEREQFAQATREASEFGESIDIELTDGSRITVQGAPDEWMTELGDE